MNNSDNKNEDNPPIEPPKSPKPGKGDPFDEPEIGDTNKPQSPSYDPPQRKDPNNDSPIKQPPGRPNSPKKL